MSLPNIQQEYSLSLGGQLSAALIQIQISRTRIRITPRSRIPLRNNPSLPVLEINNEENDESEDTG
jgi:hypothetical protein